MNNIICVPYNLPITHINNLKIYYVSISVEGELHAEYSRVREVAGWSIILLLNLYGWSIITAS